MSSISRPDEVECPVCMDVLVDPVSVDCGHVMCLRCLMKSIKAARFEAKCPLCRREVTWRAHNMKIRAAVAWEVENNMTEKEMAEYMERMAEYRAEVPEGELVEKVKAPENRNEFQPGETIDLTDY